MDRREFLAAGTTAAIATVGGCTGCAQAPAASIRMTPVSDTDIAKRVTHRLEADPDNERYRQVGEIVETGSLTVEATDKRLPTDGPLVYEETVYQLAVGVLDTTPARSVSFTLDPAEEPDDDARTIRFEDLPTVDRAKFEERGFASDPFLGFGSSFLYRESEVAESALATSEAPIVIVWDDGTRGRFTVDGSYDVTLRTYRYTASVVRESAAAYGREIRRENLVTLGGLSEAERAIVAEAIDEEAGYAVPAGESVPEPMRTLADRFCDYDDVDPVWADATPGDGRGTASGSYLVAYEGAVYWTDVRIS